jgi:predicted DNA-binding transcriptional regulator AlpA
MIIAELIHALPPSSRRGFDRKEAASYVGVSTTHFDKLVRQRVMPPPNLLLGRNVWDIRALDRVLDAMSGLDALGAHSPVGEDDDLDRELAAFGAKHGYA